MLRNASSSRVTTTWRGSARTSCARRLRRGSRTSSTTRDATTTPSVSQEQARQQRPLWRSALAKVLARRDGDTSADELAAEAVNLAATTDFLRLHGGALLDLANVRAVLNGGAAPPGILAEARGLLERKQDAASLRRAATEFSGLAVAG
jgi:hypothetical protein